MKNKNENMLTYFKLYLVQDNKVKLRKIFLKENGIKDEFVRIIGQVFNAIDINILVDYLLSGLEYHTHVCFNIFKHVCEIHLFELTPGTMDLNYHTLLQMFPNPYEILTISINQSSSSDDEENLTLPLVKY